MPEVNTFAHRVKNILLHRKWTKVCGAFVLLVLVAYFIVTSSAFVTGMVLPRVSRSLNARITAGHASVRPFSQMILSDVKIYTTESEPLFAAQEFRVRYYLWDLVHRRINVRELLLVSPSMQMVCNADGTSNLDPLLQAITKPTTERRRKPGQSAPPFQLDLKNLALTNASVRMVKIFKDRSREVMELTNAWITLTQLANAQPGSMNVTSDLKFARQAGTSNDLLQARLTASYDFGLSSDLRPQSLKGNSRFDVLLASGALKELSALGALMETQATATEITKASIRFALAGRPVGAIAISGPFDMEKREGRLRLDVESVDRRVLNLFGAARGLDFGATTLNSTNEIELAQGAAYLAAKGRFSAGRLSVTQNAQTTPAIDLYVDYDFTLDREKKFLLVNGFKFSGTQNQQAIISGEVTRPMNLVWGKKADEFEDATFSLRVNNVNLSDWRPFLGDLSGKASADLKLLSQLNGKKLQIDLSSRIDGFRTKLAKQEIEPITVAVQTGAVVDELNLIVLKTSRVQIGQQEAALALTVSGQYNRSTEDALVDVSCDAALPRLLQIVPQPGVAVTAGAAKLSGKFVQKNKLQKTSGTFVLSSFYGRCGQYRFDNFASSLDWDGEVKNHQLQIRRANGTLREGTETGGLIDLTGEWNLQKNAGDIALKTFNLNQHAVRPFLTPLLHDKKLVSVSVMASANLHSDSERGSSLKGELQVSKFVVADSSLAQPGKPLEAMIQFDGTLSNHLANVRKLQLSLSPTYRANNEMKLQGKVDLTVPTAMTGDLKLMAQSVDVTPYYDIFAAPPADSKAPEKTAPQTVAASTNAEPAGRIFPFHQFAAQLDIDRFYLREIVITNWQTKATVDGGRVLLSPCILSVNDGSINANIDVDFGVPGGRYDVALTADTVPWEPIANSFFPENRRQFKADVTVDARFNGAGTTGVSLQTNLTGQLNFSFTNATLSLVSPQAKEFLTPVAALLNLPELLQTPLNWLDAQIEMGGGKIQVKKLAMESAAFSANTHGDIPIAEVIENSPLNDFPISFSLAGPLAQKIHLASAENSAAGNYSKLPDFLKAGGTLHRPKAKIDKAALAGSVLDAISKLPGVNEKTAELLQGVSSLLGGQKPAETNGTKADPDQPANPPPAINPLNLLKKPKKK